MASPEPSKILQPLPSPDDPVASGLADAPLPPPGQRPSVLPLANADRDVRLRHGLPASARALRIIGMMVVVSSFLPYRLWSEAGPEALGRGTRVSFPGAVLASDFTIRILPAGQLVRQGDSPHASDHAASATNPGDDPPPPAGVPASRPTAAGQGLAGQRMPLADALSAAWKKIQAIQHPLLSGAGNVEPSVERDATRSGSARLNFSRNAVWKPKDGSPSAVDATQPFIWIGAAVWKAGPDSQPTIRSRGLHVDGEKYVVDVQVIASDRELAARIESILTEAFDPWSEHRGGMHAPTPPSTRAAEKPENGQQPPASPARKALRGHAPHLRTIIEAGRHARSSRGT